MVKSKCLNPYFCGVKIEKGMLKKHIMNKSK